MVIKIPKVSVSTIFVIIPILYFNSCTFEFIKHFPFVLPIVAGCILLWGALVLKEGVTINVHKIIPILGYVSILGVLFLFGGQNRVSVLLTELTNTIYLMFFMSIFAIYSNKQYKNDRAFILFVCLVDIVISCTYSIYRLINSPNLSRLLSTGSYHTTKEAISARGIVSFGVVYGLVLVLLALFFLIIQKKDNRFLNIFLILLFAGVLVLAQFFIAVLLAGIGIVWILFVSNPNNDRKRQTRFLCLIIIAIICILSSPFWLKALIDSNIFGYEINARLKELLMLFRRENLEGTDLSARFSQYILSLSAFVSSYGMGKIAVNSVDVGFHSQWLDGFGNYGAFFALYLVAIFTFRKFVIQILPNEKAKHLYKMIFAIYIIMSLTNTSTWAPITLGLCVTVPFLCLDKANEL